MAAMQAQHPDGTQPGEWRRTASGEPMAPGWGGVTPWAMSFGHQFDQGGPPALTSQEYAAAYEEVRALGGKNSPSRTAEQSHLAMFWNPHVPAKWNSLARNISEQEGLSLVESSRLFGLLSVTLADAAISVWNMKYAHNFWRPETAIRLGDTDGNDQTVEDPAWEPYLTTPAFPEYVSGHSLTCAAAATLLGRYLGTDAYAFELTTMGIPEPRSYTSLWQAVQEAGLSRIYGGIHFDFSDEQGQLAGTDLAHYVFDNFFKPL
jgi:membrane-associated phospholipid phosphatase